MITRDEWTWTAFCRAFGVREDDLIKAIGSGVLKARRCGAIMVLADVRQASEWLNEYREKE